MTRMEELNDVSRLGHPGSCGEARHGESSKENKGSHGKARNELDYYHVIALIVVMCYSEAPMIFSLTTLLQPLLLLCQLDCNYNA